ncbi:protein of unknown function [Candidatus Hydrogenisulfobacillus filiaventi]|uniref:Peptidoglycan-binding protein n=1 Tax=Candidatus Hydrogenisulfobacillus filiaventi TaxID=2707344 RepID=A0A6F8ZK99_9FIRM|nr:protein of unknown function [Candidatus Hydrogenisulfobacillus filiaventi]
MLGLGLALSPALAHAESPSALARLEAEHPAMQHVLYPWDSGRWVFTLQADLGLLGYPVPFNGTMDTATVAAVRRFQADQGLAVTGVVNAATWQDILAGFGLTPRYDGSRVPGTAGLARLLAEHPAMRQVLGYGDQGHWVATLQADLAQLGYPEVGPDDGIFGPRTLAALKAFQADNGLPVTGRTDVATWKRVLSQLGVLGGGRANGSSGQGSGGSGTQAGADLAAGGTIDGRPILAVHHMIATAYGPSWSDNYPYGPVDYFGQPLEPGMVAVDPSVIPLKSWVYVTGYTDPVLPAGGFLGRAMDEGDAIVGDRIDIYMDHGPQTVSDFGIEPVTVYVLGN